MVLEKHDAECKVNSCLQVAFVLFVLFVAIDTMDYLSLLEAPFPLDFSNTKIHGFFLPLSSLLGTVLLPAP